MARTFLITLLLIFFSLPLQAVNDEDVNADLTKLNITDSSLSYSETDGKRSVTILGTLKNTNPFPVDELIIEARFFDAQKKLVDVITQPLYQAIVPISKEVAFRLKGSADKLKDSYDTYNVQVVYAEQHFVNQPNKRRGFWTELLISLLPLLLLILVYIFYMRKCMGRNSPQMKMIPLIERQIDILEQTSVIASQNLAMIERIAVAAEKISSEKKLTSLM